MIEMVGWILAGIAIVVSLKVLSTTNKNHKESMETQEKYHDEVITLLNRKPILDLSVRNDRGHVRINVENVGQKTADSIRIKAYHIDENGIEKDCTDRYRSHFKLDRNESYTVSFFTLHDGGITAGRGGHVVGRPEHTNFPHKFRVQIFATDIDTSTYYYLCDGNEVLPIDEEEYYA